MDSPSPADDECTASTNECQIKANFRGPRKVTQYCVEAGCQDRPERMGSVVLGIQANCPQRGIMEIKIVEISAKHCT